MTEPAKRLPTPTPGDFPEGFSAEAISYWQGPTGHWYLHLPRRRFANLSGHEVTEHDDGTITVAPSILVTSPGNPRRHGWFRRGAWEPCKDDEAPITPTEGDDGE